MKLNCNSNVPKKIIQKFRIQNTDQYLYMQDVQGDGNCLFRSLSVYLDNHEEGHRELRNQIIQHLYDHFEKYKD